MQESKNMLTWYTSQCDIAMAITQPNITINK